MTENGLHAVYAPKPTRRACAREHSGLCRLIARTVELIQRQERQASQAPTRGPGVTTPDAVWKAPVTAAEEFDRLTARA
jgi:hypothetical protein